MKKLIVLALLGLVNVVQAAPGKRVEVVVTFWNTERLWEGIEGPAVEGVAWIAGVMRPDEMKKVRAEAGKGQLANLKPMKGRAGKEMAVSEMARMAVLPAVEGDFAKYGVKRPQGLDPVMVETGYKVAATAKVGPDGATIDLRMKLKICALTGFQETLLTKANLADLARRDEPPAGASGDIPIPVSGGGPAGWVLYAPDAPRERTPVLARRELTSDVTVYDGHTVVFGLGKGFPVPGCDYAYVLVTVRLLESR